MSSSRNGAELKTFWLYSGTRVLTGVRMPAESTDHQVIQKALDDAYACPGVFGDPLETPCEFQQRLHNATVTPAASNA